MHKQLKLFLIADSCYILAVGMLGPIYAIFVQRIGGDILEAGTAWAFFMISSGIGFFFMGKLQDRTKNHKTFLMIGYFMRSLVFLAYFFISNIVQMFLLQIFLGLASIITTPAAYSFYAKHVEERYIASQWSTWKGIWGVGQGIAALAGSFFAAFFGFKILFLVMFFVSLISLFIVLNIKDEILKMIYSNKITV